ncbi:MAG TPA: hypothetical protein VFF81_01385 [Noviherbaspirillum sp.]|nr:hypothetical protein [Noviherbaspirillum sp.]
MTKPDSLRDGNYAAYLEGKTANQASSQDLDNLLSGAGTDREQTLEDIILHGEEPGEQFMEEWNALQDAPPLSEEELARQALSDPGADGDVTTPE